MRPFGYLQAKDAPSAVQAARTQNGAYLAGGTTLVDLMKLGVLKPAALVDINAAAGQSEIALGATGLRLGALARMADAADHPGIKRDYPVIAQALQLAASQQIRNMASLGGNVLQRTRCSYFRDTSWAQCNKRNPGSGCAAMEGVNRSHAVLGTSSNCIATYPGDFAQALIALDARVELLGPSGARIIAFSDLHRQPGDTPDVETNLQPGEMITAFTVARAPYTARSVYVKIRDRESFSFALASAAVALDLRDNIVNEARIALGGVATVPWRARETEAMLRGNAFTEKAAEAATQLAFTSAKTRGQNAYKPELGRRTLMRALMQAAAMEV